MNKTASLNPIAGVPRTKMPLPSDGLSFLQEGDGRTASSAGNPLFIDGKPSPLLKTCITHFKDRFREINKAVGKVASIKEHKKPAVTTVTTVKGSYLTLEQAWEGAADVTEVAAALLTLRQEHKQRSKRILTPTMVKGGIKLTTSASYAKEAVAQIAQDMLDQLARLPAGETGLVACEFGAEKTGRLMVKAVLAFHNPESRSVAAPAEVPSAEAVMSEEDIQKVAFQQLERNFGKQVGYMLDAWKRLSDKFFKTPKWSRYLGPDGVNLDATNFTEAGKLDPKKVSKEGLAYFGNPTEDTGVQAFMGDADWFVYFDWKPEVKAAILSKEWGNLLTTPYSEDPQDMLKIRVGRLHAASEVDKRAARDGEGCLVGEVYGFASGLTLASGKNLQVPRHPWDSTMTGAAEELLQLLRDDFGGVLENLEEWTQELEDAPLRALEELSWDQSLGGGGFFKVQKEGRGYRAAPWLSQSERRVSDWDVDYAEPLLRAVQRALDGQAGRNMYLAVDVDPSDGSVYIERDIAHPKFRE